MNCYTLRETFAVWDCLSLSFKIELKPLESRVTKCVGSKFSIKMARSKTLNAFLRSKNSVPTKSTLSIQYLHDQ